MSNTLWALFVVAFSQGAGKTSLVLTFPSEKACEAGYQQIEGVLRPGDQVSRPDVYGAIRHVCVPGIAAPLNRSN